MIAMWFVAFNLAAVQTAALSKIDVGLFIKRPVEQKHRPCELLASSDNMPAICT